MKHKVYLQQMGVPLWQLRSMQPRKPAVVKAAPKPRVDEPVMTATKHLPAETQPEWQGLEVDMGQGAPGQQLLDECLQALRMMGAELPVKYSPDATGLRLSGRELPSMGALLAEPRRKQILWQALVEWLDEQGSTR